MSKSLFTYARPQSQLPRVLIVKERFLKHMPGRSRTTTSLCSVSSYKGDSSFRLMNEPIAVFWVTETNRST